jgi:hypothetical protein
MDSGKSSCCDWRHVFFVVLSVVFVVDWSISRSVAKGVLRGVSTEAAVLTDFWHTGQGGHIVVAAADEEEVRWEMVAALVTTAPMLNPMKIPNIKHSINVELRRDWLLGRHASLETERVLLRCLLEASCIAVR